MWLLASEISAEYYNIVSILGAKEAKTMLCTYVQACIKAAWIGGPTEFTFVYCCFAIIKVYPLYEMSRRKPEPTPLLIEGIFNLPQYTGMV